MFVYLITIAIPILNDHIQFWNMVTANVMAWQLLGSVLKYGAMATGVYMVYKELTRQQAEQVALLTRQQAEQARQQMAFTIHAFNAANRSTPNMVTVGASPQFYNADMRSQNLRDRSELIRILQLVNSEKSPNEIAIIADEMLAILNK
jgi:hypothetical protein